MVNKLNREVNHFFTCYFQVYDVANFRWWYITGIVNYRDVKLDDCLAIPHRKDKLMSDRLLPTYVPSWRLNYGKKRLELPKLIFSNQTQWDVPQKTYRMGVWMHENILWLATCPTTRNIHFSYKNSRDKLKFVGGAHFSLQKYISLGYDLA